MSQFSRENTHWTLVCDDTRSPRPPTAYNRWKQNKGFWRNRVTKQICKKVVQNSVLLQRFHFYDLRDFSEGVRTDSKQVFIHGNIFNSKILLNYILYTSVFSIFFMFLLLKRSKWEVQLNASKDYTYKTHLVERKSVFTIFCSPSLVWRSSGGL